ncbi:MAG: hypothetical protein ACI358_00930 [Candidatus Limimorpha sp.]
MKHHFLMIGLLLSFFKLYSWDLSGIIGGRSNSMGNCSVALNDLWSISNNPAGIAGTKGVIAGFSYDNRFFMKELSNYAIAVVIPSSSGAIGLSFNRFGYSNYNENKIGLAYSRGFGEKLKIGMKLDYLLFRFSKEYPTRQCATVELGIQTSITETINIGVYIFNPVYVKIRELESKIPIITRCGFSYSITKDLILAGEIEYDTDKKADFRFGFEYHTLKEFYIRAGIYTNPATACFGAGYSFNGFTIDISSKLNQYTGISFQSSVTILIHS